ncbi:MAG TPA: class A beta-lactamase [Allosphingosinicella sp.]|jgi:beta-lactamase class A|nr:class A beta-lactamase [Allosphingosinicella sp.]
MLSWLLAAMLNLAVSGAVVQPDPQPGLARIERQSGGRLGVALIDGRGRSLMAHRAGERFAMCSTFKLLLAGMHAQTAGARQPMNFTRADLRSNSPFSERMLGRLDAGSMRVGFAAEHAIVESDNTAANLLLRRMGGPEAFTRRLRELGDTVTRLDRYELGLNENVRSDPRDTTSPAAMALTASRFVLGNVLHPAWRTQLRGWMVASRTGQRRIRAGLPAGWQAGDKTGTCGTAYNDVAFLVSPGGREYMLAVHLDRPSVPAARAEAAIADVGRLAAARIAEMERAAPRRRR